MASTILKTQFYAFINALLKMLVWMPMIVKIFKMGKEIQVPQIHELNYKSRTVALLTHSHSEENFTESSYKRPESREILAQKAASVNGPLVKVKNRSHFFQLFKFHKSYRERQ